VGHASSPDVRECLNVRNPGLLSGLADHEALIDQHGFADQFAIDRAYIGLLTERQDPEHVQNPSRILVGQRLEELIVLAPQFKSCAPRTILLKEIYSKIVEAASFDDTRGTVSTMSTGIRRHSVSFDP
jgi:hypothetical protein